MRINLDLKCLGSEKFEGGSKVNSNITFVEVAAKYCNAAN